MQKKLNESFIETYSEDFSNEVISAYFEDKHSISGKEILNLSPSRQVNMFVLMILFRKWQDEIKALESPYFDYKNAEVRKAMIQFMNVLSQHIEVSASDLQPLLVQAVQQTIRLAADPAVYIKLEIDQLEGTAVTEKITQPILKYLKLHKEDIQEFVQINIPSSSDEFIKAAEDYFDDYEVTEVLTQEALKLSEVKPIEVDEIFEKEDDLPVFDDEEGESASEEISFFDQDLDEEDEEEVSEPEDDNEPTEEEEEIQHFERPQKSNVISEDLDDEDIEIEEEDIELIEFDDEEQESDEEAEENEESETSKLALPEEDEEDEEDEEEEGTVNSRFSKPSATLNETFGNNKEDETLSDHLEKRKVSTIMDAISINNRYMFTKELFNDDKDTFTSAINELEKMNSFDEAVEKLIHSYAKTYGWDMNSPEVKELLKVVFRRFR